MSKPRILPPTQELQKMVEQGMTHQQIVDKVNAETGENLTNKSVAVALYRAALTNRVRYDDYLPWSPVLRKHANMWHAAMLRLAARESRGAPMTATEADRLAAWRQRLNDVNGVVTYDREDGYYLAPRRPGVDLGLIRVPDGDEKTAELSRSLKFLAEQ